MERARVPGALPRDEIIKRALIDMGIRGTRKFNKSLGNPGKRYNIKIPKSPYFLKRLLSLR
jgi:hypothetical protein